LYTEMKLNLVETHDGTDMVVCTWCTSCDNLYALNPHKSSLSVSTLRWIRRGFLPGSCWFPAGFLPVSCRMSGFPGQPLIPETPTLMQHSHRMWCWLGKSDVSIRHGRLRRLWDYRRSQ